MVWFQGSRCEWQVILAIITEGSKDLWEWRMVLGALYPGSLQKREKGHPRTPDGPVMERSSQGARQLQCGLGSWCPIPQRLWNPSPVTSSWPSLQASEGASSELFSPTFTSDKLESLQLKFPRNNGCILQANPWASLSADSWWKLEIASSQRKWRSWRHRCPRITLNGRQAASGSCLLGPSRAASTPDHPKHVLMGSTPLPGRAPSITTNQLMEGPGGWGVGTKIIMLLTFVQMQHSPPVIVSEIVLALSVPTVIPVLIALLLD